MKIMSKKKIWVKVVALTLIQSFIGWNAATAAVSERSMWQQRGKVSQIGTSVSSNILEQENLQKGLFAEYFVPENAGTINEFWVPKGMDKNALTSSKLLIHVRDAHCNYEAQENIASIIQNFVNNNSLDFVAIEGAEGTVDYASLRTIPDNSVLSRVSNDFMKLGRLSGAEYANINSRQAFDLFGAEDKAIYNSNLNNFRKTLTFKKDGVEFVRQIKTALDTLKENMYSPELKELEEMTNLYNNREISFVDYCQYLYNLPAAENVRTGYKNFALLMEAIRVQDLIDFSQIETEKTELVNELARKVASEDLNLLGQATVDFRRGKLSTANYYQIMGKLAKEAEVDMAQYKNLRPYMVYLNVYEQIDSAELFNEKETLESEIKRSLFKNLDQARLDKLSKNADILEKVFSVRLTNADLAYFQDFRTDFTTWEFKSFIQEQAPKYNLTFNIDFSKDPIDQYLPELEAFYMEAKTRDNVLVNNTLAQMDLEGKNIGVLVSGGFHTAGITSYLRSQNVPYMVVTPRILREDVNNPYLELITGNLLPVEKLLIKPYQFSLSVPVNAAQTAALIKDASNGDPQLSSEDRAQIAGQADFKNGIYELADGTKVAVVSRTVGNNIQIFATPEDLDKVKADIEGKNIAVADAKIGSESAVAQAEDTQGALKGKIQAESEAPLKEAAKVAVSIDSLPVNGQGVQDFIAAVLAKAGALAYPVKVSQIGDDQAYAGINQPGLDLGLALKDQHVAVVVDGEVILAEGLIYLLAARYIVAQDQATQERTVDQLVTIIQHEQAVAKALAEGKDRGAAHVEALTVDQAAIAADEQLKAAIEAEGLTGNDVAFNQFFNSLDQKSPELNQELVDAVRALRSATDAQAAITASSVLVAFNSIRDEDAARSKVSAALKTQDVELFDEVLTRSLDSESDILGVFVRDGEAFLADSRVGIGAELNREQTVELPDAFVDALAEKGITRIVFEPTVPTELRAKVLSAAIRPEVTVAELTAIDGLNVQGVKLADNDIRISVQPITAENAASTAAAIQPNLEATQNVAANATNAGDKQRIVYVDADDLYVNGKLDTEVALPLLQLSVTQNLANIPTLNVVVIGDNAAEVQAQLAEAANSDRIFTQESFTPEADSVSVYLSSKDAADLGNPERLLSLSELTSDEQVVRFDAAFSLATAWAVYENLQEIAQLVTPFLLQLGVTDEEIQAFITNPFALRPVERPTLNLMTIKLAIAA